MFEPFLPGYGLCPFCRHMFHSVWGALLPGIALTLAAIVLHLLGKHFGKWLYLAGAACNSIAAGLALTAFYHYNKIPVRMTGLLCAYTLFIILGLIFCAMFLCIRKRFIMALSGGLLLAGLTGRRLSISRSARRTYLSCCVSHPSICLVFYGVHALIQEKARRTAQYFTCKLYRRCYHLPDRPPLFIGGDLSIDLDFGSRKKQPQDIGQAYPWL